MSAHRTLWLVPALLLLPGSSAVAKQPDSTEAIVQRQVDAYNARDVHAFVATYAPDAEIYEYPAKLLMKGSTQIEEFYGSKRFGDTRLHATIVKRIVMGDVVVDYEKIVLTLPQGPGRLEGIAIYEVKAGKIARVTLIRGKTGVG